MKLTTDQKKDKEIFRRIFLENWDNFKDRYPAYASDQYEVPVQKMLNCSKEFGGYCEFVSVVKVVFVCRAQKSMLIIW